MGVATREQRDIRELKQFLKALAETATRCAAELDDAMRGPSTEARGKEVARIANVLNYAADSAMHFGLRMDFKDINKMKRSAAKAAHDPLRPHDLSSRFGSGRVGRRPEP